MENMYKKPIEKKSLSGAKTAAKLSDVRSLGMKDESKDSPHFTSKTTSAGTRATPNAPEKNSVPRSNVQNVSPSKSKTIQKNQKNVNPLY